MACPRDGTTLTPINAGQHLIGKVLEDRYEVLEVIGAGATGSILKARQRHTDRPVAIKLLPAEFARDAVNVKRLQREAKVLAMLEHPHIVRTYDCSMTRAGEPYLVIEYVEGRSLKEILDERVKLPVGRALSLFSMIADGMNYAHTKGVLHRDLKPHNMMVTREETEDEGLKLLDFGIATMEEVSQKLTQVGEAVGSPFYMSPEQCQAKEVDERSDIYSLGVVMYLTLTGEFPFMSDNVMEVFKMKSVKKAPRFDKKSPGLVFPDFLEDVVLKCLEIDPGKRFASMADVKEQLDLISRMTGSAQSRMVESDKARRGIKNEATDPKPTFTPAERMKTSGGGDLIKYAAIIGVVVVLIFASVLGFRALSGGKPEASVKQPVPSGEDESRVTSGKTGDTDAGDADDSGERTGSEQTALSPLDDEPALESQSGTDEARSSANRGGLSPASLSGLSRRSSSTSDVPESRPAMASKSAKTKDKPNHLSKSDKDEPSDVDQPSRQTTSEPERKKEAKPKPRKKKRRTRSRKRRARTARKAPAKSKPVRRRAYSTIQYDQ